MDGTCDDRLGRFQRQCACKHGSEVQPDTNSWTVTSRLNAPAGRGAHAAIWTGNEMIVWGRYSVQQNRFFKTGGRDNPTTNSWTATTTINAPHEADFPTAVWTGSQMIVFGGFFSFYDPFGHYIHYFTQDRRTILLAIMFADRHVAILSRCDETKADAQG